MSNNDAENPDVDNEPSTSTRTRNLNISRINSVARRNRIRRQRMRSTSGFVRFQRQQQYFIKRVYLLALAFISLSVFQWILIVSNPLFVDFMMDKYYIPLITGLLALMLLTVFVVVLEIRYTEPYNWIAAYAIVELETVALIQSPLEADMNEIGFCFLATTLISIVFRYIGVWCPRDLTQDVICIIFASLFFFLSATISLIVLFQTEILYMRLTIIFGMIVFLLVYLMFMSQLIMGNRTGTLRWSDLLLAALMVYFNFVLLFSSVLNLWREVCHLNLFELHRPDH